MTKFYRIPRFKRPSLPTYSVCIPVHITADIDLQFLSECIRSVIVQKFVIFEILISDDSLDFRVKAIVDDFVTQGISIRMLEPPKSQGLGSNLNHCLENAHGRVVKILFQDDYLSYKMSLFISGTRLRFSRKKWMATATTHFNQENGNYQNRFKPRESDDLLDGKNSISSPSVILLKRNHYVPFSQELKYLIDCEWYLRMSHRFGLPIFFNKISVVNRLHENQSTHVYSHLLAVESVRARELHNLHSMRASLCSCLRDSN